MKAEKGFSIIELLVTLAVFGIMLSTGVSSFMDLMPGYRLNGAARQLKSDLMLARMRAVNQNNQFVLMLDPQGKSYSIIDDDNGNGIADTGESVSVKDLSTVYSGVQLSSVTTISFSPQGTASPAVWTVTSSEGSASEVRVSFAGSITIVDMEAGG